MNKNVDWDASLNMTNRIPTKDALRRIRAELKRLVNEPLPGIFCVQDEVNMCIVHALIIGPFGKLFFCIVYVYRYGWCHRVT